MGTTNAASEAAFQEEMMRIVRDVQWSFLATAQEDQPRVRVVHAVWEGFVCYVATDPTSPKAKQIADNPRTEMIYWAPAPKFQHVTVTGVGSFVPDDTECKRVYDLFATAPEGYDPKMLWPNGPDATFAVLRIDSLRIEITGMLEQLVGIKRRLWKA